MGCGKSSPAAASVPGAGPTPAPPAAKPISVTAPITAAVAKPAAKSSTKVVVIGASGHVGATAIPALTAAFANVTVVTREPSSKAATAASSAGARVVTADMGNKPSVVAAFRGADSAYIIFPGTEVREEGAELLRGATFFWLFSFFLSLPCPVGCRGLTTAPRPLATPSLATQCGLHAARLRCGARVAGACMPSPRPEGCATSSDFWRPPLEPHLSRPTLRSPTSAHRTLC